MPNNPEETKPIESEKESYLHAGESVGKLASSVVQSVVDFVSHNTHHENKTSTNNHEEDAMKAYAQQVN